MKCYTTANEVGEPMKKMQDKTRNLCGIILVMFSVRLVELYFLLHYDLQSKKIDISIEEETKLLTTLLLTLL